MNALIRKFAALFTGSAVMAALSGCAGAFDPATDPSSPAAARVQTLVDGNRGYPRWEDFPRRTQPIPAPAEIAERVNALESASGRLAGEVESIDWQTSGDASAYAAAARARVASVGVSAPSAETAAEIESFARRARERGRAPPPIPRR